MCLIFDRKIVEHQGRKLALEKKCFYENFFFSNYRSGALKSRSKLRAAIGLRAAFDNFLLHQN